ncbi:DUF1127 domain-containing protein [Sinorhizobium mexicanum]|uniref:DUF1127 domain-containing protein n=1 Tax=Sinorhizobium mexicanum TaxID=375549 RepID=A0A859QJ73_9HYPH|nr:uncharacterized protein YjiS (DUF1127 family) [Sinorhizobium mexicanum]QLL62250.1 DUF1127 domain-containing protein [Sinorhizobium mexicanum]
MFIASILLKFRAHQRYRQTLRTFRQLNDHLLEDVGISRNDIDVIARRQYHEEDRSGITADTGRAPLTRQEIAS